MENLNDYGDIKKFFMKLMLTLKLNWAKLQ